MMIRNFTLEEIVPSELVMTIYDGDYNDYSKSDDDLNSEVIIDHHGELEVILEEEEIDSDFSEEFDNYLPVSREANAFLVSLFYDPCEFGVEDVEEIELQTGFAEKFDVLQIRTLFQQYKNIKNVALVVDHMEIAILFYGDFTSSKNKEQLLRSIAHAAKHLAKGSVLLNETMLNIFRQMCSIIFENIQLQSFLDWSTSIDELLSCFDMFEQSDLIQKATLVFKYMISFSTFQLYNVDPITNLKRVKDFSHKLQSSPLIFTKDFMKGVLELLKSAIEHFTVFLKTGSFSDLLYTPSYVSKWLEDCQQIHLDYAVLSNPEPFEVSPQLFELTLERVLEEGKHLLKQKNVMTVFESSILKRKVDELAMLDREYTLAKLARMTREPPFSILVYGDSSVGKSSFLSILFDYYSKVSTHAGVPLPNEECYMYTRCPADEYWSQFNTYQWCILLDDIAITLPSKGTEDRTLNEIIRVINTEAWVPPQAEVERKGKHPVRPKLVLGSTNTKDLNASHWFSAPLAAQRRFPYVITLCPKEEVILRVPNSKAVMLDSEKARNFESEGYDDLWKIKVDIVVPGPSVGASDRVQAAYVTVLETESMAEFLKWLGPKILKFMDEVKHMKGKMEKYADVKICKTCLTTSCECVSLETGFSEMCESICSRGFNYICCFLVTLVILAVCKLISMCFRYFGFIRCVDMVSRFSNFTENSFLIYGAKVVKNRAILVSLLAVLGSIILFLSLRKKKKEEIIVEGIVHSGLKPERVSERANQWEWKEPPKLTSFDIPREMMSRGSLPLDKQIAMIEKNCFHATLYTASESAPAQILGLFGQIYLTNAHHFEKVNCTHMVLTRTGFASAADVRRRINLEENVNLFLFKEKDMAIIIVRDLPPVKDIRSFFLKSNCDVPRMNGSYLLRSIDGSFRMNDIHSSVQMRKFLPLNGGVNMLTYANVTRIPTQKGDCGSTHIGYVGGKVIIFGIHVGKNVNTGEALSVGIFLDQIQACTYNLPSIHKISASEPVPHSKNELKMNVLHEKSPLRFLEEAGDATVHGSQQYQYSTKSRVGKTLLGKDFVKATQGEQYAIVDQMVSPIMTGYRPRRINIQYMLNTSDDVDYSLVDEIIKSMSNEILKLLPKEELALIQQLDLDTAINGADGIAYIDALKRNTSSGFPWRCVKKNLMIFNEENDRVQITDEVIERIECIEERYSAGERFHPIFTASLKDEPVTLKKQKDCKTRVFSAAPMDFTIFMRQLLLPVIRVIQRNTAVFETAVGVQAQSKEWEVIYDRITKFGKDRIVAGDFSKFDKRMSPTFILAAFSILKNICIAAGYSDEQLKAIDGIANDIAFPLTDYFGDFITFHGTSPSGHMLTVILNSLVHSIYYRYAYGLLNPKSTLSTFRDHVSLVTYGDDGVASISVDAPWFNHTEIQRVLSTIGVLYTMAEKEKDSIPYIHIDEASFLKRRFVYNKDIGGIVGPLDHDSISKMLTSCVRSKDFIPELHMMCVVKSALEEYFWYGKAVFLDRRRKFQEIVNNTNLPLFAGDFNMFPTWEELVERYQRASEPFMV
jgi:hypothetical protein